MKKQLPAIVLAIVCAVLAYLLNDTVQKNARLVRELVAVTQSVNAAGQPPADTIATESPEEKPVVVAQAVAEESAEVDPNTVEETLKSHQRIMSSIAKMQDNPTMNKVLEASQRGTIGALYSDLIEYLDMDSDESKYFMDLLMYRQMANVDFGMKLMSGQMSEEEKQQMAEHIGEVHDETYEQMKTFLNSEEDFEEFEYYEKTMNERMALSQMDQTLAGTEDELSDESYRELLDMMHEESKNFEWSTDLHEQENSDVSAQRFSPDNMKKHTDDVYSLVEDILTKADGMLSSVQLEAFKASLMQTTDMQVAQLQMAGQLLGGGE